jgi:iron(III) transport system substrate-binding protein
MRYRLPVGLLLALALLVGCAPPPSPAGPSAAQPGAAPPSAASGSPTAAWDGEWSALVEAARREGKVVLKGPPDQKVRTDVPRAFRDRYGVEVEYVGGPSGEAVTQLEKERAAGIYTTDVILAGSDSMYTGIYRLKMLDPLPPALIHPDARDASKWPGNKLWFMDPEGQYILRLSNELSVMGQINTAYFRPEEFTSWSVLLRPDLRGKMASFDPRGSGSGIATAAYLYVTLGEEFVKQLYIEQRPIFSREQRQLADWVARGIYPIIIGGSAATEHDIEEFRQGGIHVVPLSRPPEAPGGLSAGFGLMGLMNGAPHPNAAKLLANWLASREGMEVWSKARDLVPVRNDIDKAAWEPRGVVPDPDLDKYIDTYGWDFVLEHRQRVIERLRQLIP